MCWCCGLLLIMAQTDAARYTECGAYADAPPPQTLLVVGYVGSGRREVTQLLDASGLCSSPPHASSKRDEQTKSFDAAGLSRLAHVVAAAVGRAQYNTSEVELGTRQQLQAALCRFFNDTAASRRATVAPQSWCWGSQDAIYLLPFLLEFIGRDFLRILIVTVAPRPATMPFTNCVERTREWQQRFFGARYAADSDSDELYSRVWAEVHVAALLWGRSELKTDALLHIRFEDITRPRSSDIALATMGQLLSWVGWTSIDNATIYRYIAPVVEVAGWFQHHTSGIFTGISREALRALGYDDTTGSPVPYWPLAVQRALLPASQATFLAEVAAGRVSRSRLEVVMVRFNEEIGWASEILPVTTLYNRGRRLPSSELHTAVEVMQPNIGRESSAYLTHIVAHFDSLAEVTVFTHASAPSPGFRTDKDGILGGHMQSGGSIYDYVLAEPGSQGHFTMTDVLSLHGHSPRLESWDVGGAFKLHDLPRWGAAPGPAARPPRCFDPTLGRWKHKTPAVLLGEEAARDCRLRAINMDSYENSSAREAWAAAQNVRACSLADFWDSVLREPRPRGDVVWYTQGARFAATSEQIRRRPVSDYQRLLTTTLDGADPYAGYLLEVIWWYVVAGPDHPCATQDDAQTAWMRVQTAQRQSLSPKRSSSNAGGILKQGSATSCHARLMSEGHHCCEDADGGVSVFNRDEFGTEFLLSLPVAYAAFLRGKLVETVGCGEMQALYFFSPQHVDVHDCRRAWRPEAFADCGSLGKSHSTKVQNSSHWHPPPLKEHFRALPLPFDLADEGLPLVVVLNKFNVEWNHAPVNFLSKELLGRIFSLLREHGLPNVVYHRPLSADQSDVLELGDFEYIREQHPEVVLVADLTHSELSANELLVRSLAHSRHVICVQGGLAIAAGYFASEVLVLHKEGNEIHSHEYEQLFSRFANSSYIVAEAESKLLEKLAERAPLWAAETKP